MTWRRLWPPTRSPTRICTPAGSAATGGPPRSTSRRTGVDWHERFSDLERRAALWNYALFFWGEDAVADNLSPFIDAAPREEQKYFLATQQVDEARHADLLQALHARGLRHRRRHRRRRAGGDPAAADLGLRQDVRAARQARRRAAPRPLAHQARPGGDALPRDHRGGARAAGPALHRGLPAAQGRAARLPRRHAQRRARRAAPHRLRRQAAARPRGRGPGGAARRRRPAARGAALQRRRVRPAGLGPALLGGASASRSRRSTRRAGARSSPSCARPACRSSRCPGRSRTRSSCRRTSAPGA